ncbi:hydroxyacid dehydrogenase [uncultured Cohaesibacter sp.]|uniref:hydroxyacid dehydrogenase n=1 Tax=uncultured Cohaesibacter sp. TaxID=1002546 RepID=UPI0029C68AEC|nr:hydroxyacid dehydrogenase [uncultured Cohaesibacter sp.]
MDTVLLSHPLYKDGMEVLKGKVNVNITNEGDSDIILPQLQQADGFILRIGKIDRKAIEACPNLKVIARPGVGVDSVDIDAATENGIPVVVAPRANSRSVAEHALALMLSISKNLLESDTETRKGNFSIREKYATTELAGLTVGVVGFGNIAQFFAGYCAALGMQVLVFDPYVSEEVISGAGYRNAADLEELFQNSDVISLHVPSTPTTKNMINAVSLGMMKPNALLVNTARGDLIDEAALYDALSTNRIKAAGLDVLHAEPMPSGHPLFSLPNLLVSPHLAAQTPQATAKAVVMAAEGTLAILRGERWKNVFNPSVYDHPKWQGT